MQRGSRVPGVRSHEELICWQLSNELKVQVCALLKSGSVVQDFDFSDQIRRSASSAARNIAEGFGRYLPGDSSGTSVSRTPN
jgi:four helix bundle protein